MEQRFANGRRMLAEAGDITRVHVDVIVNAANSALVGGGGVDGAIHRAGGPSIMRELDEIRPRIGQCPTGSAVATSAGKLDAKFVFHAVGPVYRDGKHGEPELLASCYATCLRMADERGARTIAFPAISTGVYGYPAAEAAQIAVETVRRYLASAQTSVEQVRFVVFGEEARRAYEQAFADQNPSEPRP
jgi:O-acetyl-ADP-ribose deacetylase (regulator of RNase III)